MRRAGSTSKPPKDHGPLPAGTRAPDRHVRWASYQRVWMADDFPADGFRLRRDALKHCKPGRLPRLVTVTRGF